MYRIAFVHAWWVRERWKMHPTIFLLIRQYHFKALMESRETYRCLSLVLSQRNPTSYGSSRILTNVSVLERLSSFHHCFNVSRSVSCSISKLFFFIFPGEHVPDLPSGAPAVDGCMFINSDHEHHSPANPGCVPACVISVQYFIPFVPCLAHEQGRNHVFKVGGPIPWSRLLYRTKYGWYTQFRALQSVT